MATVKITSQLISKLQGTALTPLMLVQSFSDWKDGDEYSSYSFSQSKTENGATLAHMVQVTSGADMNSWNHFWDVGKSTGVAAIAMCRMPTLKRMATS